jgi:hypothetical protein
LLWLVGYKNKVYLIRMTDLLDGYIILGKVDVGNIIKLEGENHPLKEYAYVINDQN